MFLDKVIERNNKLIDSSVLLYNQGKIEADSYIIDVDNFLLNAKKILEEADKHDIKLYFMLKQIGRNPYLGKKLIEMGYKGAVAVDFREAKTMMENNIPLGNVGHLVQTPKKLIKEIMIYGTEVFTVFSLEKLMEINDIAQELGITQSVIVKVSGKKDLFYSGQYGGIELENLNEFIEKAKKLSNIRLVGVTAFPCYLYNEKKGEIEETNNYKTLVEAVDILKRNNCIVKEINTPSTTSVETIKLMSKGIGNVGEPGHGLTGTTPAHAAQNLVEIPSIIYISEVSHTFRGKSYVYGGGYYRRSHLKDCLVFNGLSCHKAKVNKMDDSSIDYYFEIDSVERISSPIIMAFRFQVFVTRSRVVLVEGIRNNTPKISGVYSSLGDVIYEQ